MNLALNFRLHFEFSWVDGAERYSRRTRSNPIDVKNIKIKF